jgi:hypothetical protein
MADLHLSTIEHHRHVDEIIDDNIVVDGKDRRQLRRDVELDITNSVSRNERRHVTTMRTITLTMAGLAIAVSVHAGERGTPAEAKAMLEKAVAHYKAVGRKQALADFNAKKAPFSGSRLMFSALARIGRW